MFNFKLLYLPIYRKQIRCTAYGCKPVVPISILDSSCCTREKETLIAVEPDTKTIASKWVATLERYYSND